MFRRVMNEFVAKKLGEVHAFVSLVIDTYAKGSAGFTKALPEEEMIKEIAQLSDIQARIETIAEDAEVKEIALGKSAKTLEKIAAARDTYIAERWDDTVELYEWSSFNAGAGSAHAHEVYGAALATNNQALANVTRAARNMFEALLADSKDYLYQEGVRRANEA